MNCIITTPSTKNKNERIRFQDPTASSQGAVLNTMQQQATITVAKKTAQTGNIATFLDQYLAFHNPLIDCYDNLHPVAFL